MLNPITGYQPDPELEGYGTASFADGSSLFVPQTEVDTSLFNPQLGALAQNMSEQPGMSEPNMSVGAAPPAPAETDYAAYFTQPEATPEQQAYEAVAAQYGQQPQQAPAPQQAPGVPEGFVFDPGAPATKGGFKPTTRTTQGRMGYAPQAYAQFLHGNRGQQTEINVARAQVQEKIYGDELARTRGQLDALNIQRGREEKAQRDAQEMVRYKWSAVEQAGQAYRDKKVDPKRVFSGTGGTLAGIGAAIAQGMTAYAAIMTNNPGIMRDFVGEMIDRDIADQEREREMLGEDYDNALNMYAKYTGDLGEAREMLRATQTRIAQVEAEKMAAAAKLDNVQIDFLDREREADAQMASHAIAYNQAMAPTISEGEKYTPGSPGRRAGLRPQTTAEIEKETKNIEARNKNQEAKDRYATGASEGAAQRVAFGEDEYTMRDKESAAQARSAVITQEQLSAKYTKMYLLQKKLKETSALDPIERRAIESELEQTYAGAVALRAQLLTKPGETVSKGQEEQAQALVPRPENLIRAGVGVAQNPENFKRALDNDLDSTATDTNILLEQLAVPGSRVKTGGARPSVARPVRGRR